MLHGTNLLHFSCHGLDAGILTAGILYFAQFDAEAAQFHHAVNTATVFELTVGIIACQVASTVNQHVANLNKLLGSQVLTVQIALGHLWSCQAQLSHHTLWQEVALLVEDERLGIGNRTANGDVRVFLLVDDMERRAYRKLCGTVAVDDLDRGLLERQHLLAAHHEELQGQVGVFVDHRHTQLGTHGHTGDAVLDNERTQEFHVFPDLF